MFWDILFEMFLIEAGIVEALLLAKHRIVCFGLSRKLGFGSKQSGEP